MVTQFIAAFDDIIINRYNKSREVVDKIKVRYLYAPKERVIFDLINKNQNLTVPAVAASIGGVERDETRVFNKIYGGGIQFPVDRQLLFWFADASFHPPVASKVALIFANRNFSW